MEYSLPPASSFPVANPSPRSRGCWQAWVMWPSAQIELGASLESLASKRKNTNGAFPLRGPPASWALCEQCGWHVSHHLADPPLNQGPGCPVSTAPHASPFGALRCCSLLSRTWVWFAFCDPEAHVWPTPPLPLFFLGSDIKAACFWKVLSLKVY